MNGFINILKPPGMTSAAVVATLRRLTGGKKPGTRVLLTRKPPACSP